ncbi:MAG: hypothetical protein AAF614_03065 [Chloroflexota bacterium]
MSLLTAVSFRDMVETAVSPAQVEAGLQRFFQTFHGQSGQLPADAAAQFGYLTVGNHQVGLQRWQADEAAALIASLDQQIGTPLSLNGDKHVVDDNGNQMIKAGIAGTDQAIYWLFRCSLALPDYVITIAHQVLAGWGTVWQRLA